ncbi:nuclear transport factor 2 family protein [Frateuria hangzhouensis]|uniref:nuclear transport factor 2 family protein n=1 Tax=Frateuria hangzhouensis TaxID=2995589 RepID=UPI002260BCD1|nr:nuclear transport factor 2 family protein [Frateuria sp. STR12]MCX7513391.1 nuclear transport factor 2 family protein [Frateuria sp. STR12]
MRTLSASMLATGLALAAAVPAAPAAAMNETAHSPAAVKAVDQHWLDAELDGDTDYLASLLLPAYRSVGADGVVHARRAILANAAKNRGSDRARRKAEAWRKTHPSGQQVVLQGDTAILSFYDPALGPVRGVRSSDVFVYVDGRWRAIYSQHSRPGGN